MRGDFDEDELDDDDPECPECGCDLFTEDHDWDCSYYGDDECDEDFSDDEAQYDYEE